MSIENAVNWAETFFYCTSSAAILAGGIAAYVKFFVYRQRYPKLNVSSTVASTKLTGAHNLVRVTLTLENIGPRMVEIRQGYANLLLVRPCDDEMRRQIETGEFCSEDNTAALPLLQKRTLPVNYPREIEPGETDQVHFDFILDSHIEAVCAHVNLANPNKAKRSFAWEQIRILEINPGLPSNKDNGQINLTEKERSMNEKSTRVEVTQVVERQVAIKPDPRAVLQLPMDEQTIPKPDPRPAQPTPPPKRS